MAATRSTRQLLGELDALMDQMLSLPVEEGARIATAEPRPVPPPQHPLAVTMTLLDTSTEVAEPALDEPKFAEPKFDEPQIDEPQIDEPIATPSIELPEANEPPAVDDAFWVQEADLVPDPSPRPLPVRGRTATVPVPSRPLEVSPIARLPARTVSRPYAWALRLHRTLTRRTYGLGFVGRFLRSDFGYTILGVLGILMLLIAAGWLAKDLLHWT